MPLSFLLIGLAWEEISIIVGADKAAVVTEQAKAALAKDEARFRAAGLGYDLLAYGSEEDMGRLEDKLKEGRYDGVCIGYGVRATKELTPLFERLINTIMTISPSTKLFFNTAPDDSLQAAKRWFPEIDTSAHA